MAADPTPDDFKRFLQWLDSDPQVAEKKYITIWNKLVMYFNGCPDPSEHAHEVLFRIARRVDLDKVLNFNAFAYGVARNVRSEIRKKPIEMPIEDTVGRRVSHTGPNPERVEDKVIRNIDSKREVVCLQECLAELPTDERKLFLAYELAEPQRRAAERKKLAMQYGLSEGTLKVRTHRIRSDLHLRANQRLASRGKDSG